MAIRLIATLALLAAAGITAAHESPAGAHYLGNEGVLIAHGDTRVLFDPLFREDFDLYELPPADIRQALFDGTPPYADIDAVFISHYHDDHFDPADVRDYLARHEDVALFAPRQAVAAIRALGTDDAALFDRITAIDLEVGDAPREYRVPGLQIDVVRIPHSGWPSRHANVENLAWRVTLDSSVTVLHLGDADTRDEHYATHATHWGIKPLHLALPPYWYFLSASGRDILATRLRPGQAVGIHVPADVPDERAAREPRLRDADLFTRPGETRQIPH